MTYAEERKQYEQAHKEPSPCNVCGKLVYTSKWFDMNGRTVCDECLGEEFKEEDWEE